MNEFQDAFIIYDRPTSEDLADRLYHRLMEQGLSVCLAADNQLWGNDAGSTDGAKLDHAILEQSHNILLIVTPKSVLAAGCLGAIALAHQYNKRIFLLSHIEAISQEEWQQQHPTGTDEDWVAYQSAERHLSTSHLPTDVQHSPRIDFEDQEFEQALAELVTQLNHKRSYIHRHTLLLTKALAWERQQKAPEYLLAGTEQQLAVAWLNTYFQATLWLKTNASIPLNPADKAVHSLPQPTLASPTDLHCEFIGESKKKVNHWMTEVFLCFVESDRAFATQIRSVLLQQGITVWTEQVPQSDPQVFSPDIQAGIEAADNVVYLISPQALQSPLCQQAVSYALRLRKRILPLLAELTQLAALPPEQQGLTFIDFTRHRNPAYYYVALDQFLYALNEDRAYHALGKVLLVKALAWDRQNQDASLWLEKDELDRAERWLNQSLSQKLKPTALQQHYIRSSRQRMTLPEGDLQKAEGGFGKLLSLFSRR